MVACWGVFCYSARLMESRAVSPFRPCGKILALVGDGLRNTGIAEQLSISISTVKAHIYNIFSKLQVSSRTEAVSKARKLGIL